MLAYFELEDQSITIPSEVASVIRCLTTQINENKLHGSRDTPSDKKAESHVDIIRAIIASTAIQFGASFKIKPKKRPAKKNQATNWHSWNVYICFDKIDYKIGKIHEYSDRGLDPKYCPTCLRPVARWQTKTSHGAHDVVPASKWKDVFDQVKNRFKPIFYAYCSEHAAGNRDYLNLSARAAQDLISARLVSASAGAASAAALPTLASASASAASAAASPTLASASTIAASAAASPTFASASASAAPAAASPRLTSTSTIAASAAASPRLTSTSAIAASAPASPTLVSTSVSATSTPTAQTSSPAFYIDKFFKSIAACGTSTKLSSNASGATEGDRRTCGDCENLHANYSLLQRIEIAKKEGHGRNKYSGVIIGNQYAHAISSIDRTASAASAASAASVASVANPSTEELITKFRILDVITGVRREIDNYPYKNNNVYKDEYIFLRLICKDGVLREEFFKTIAQNALHYASAAISNIPINFKTEFLDSKYFKK